MEGTDYTGYGMKELVAIIKEGNDEAYKEFQRRWKFFEESGEEGKREEEWLTAKKQ